MLTIIADSFSLNVSFTQTFVVNIVALPELPEVECLCHHHLLLIASKMA